MTRTMASMTLMGAGVLSLGCPPVTKVVVSPGSYHTCATLQNGDGRCWGKDAEGQLGDGAAGASRSNPMPVSGLAPSRAVASGGLHSCALLADNGYVYCWGDNSRGQLGAGSSAASSAVPLKVGWLSQGHSPTTLSFVRSVSTADFHSCAALDNGEVFCWGNNQNSELGGGVTGGMSKSPALVPTLHVANVGGPPKALEVTAAGQFTCARLADLTVWCWGLNNHGQLGRGNTSSPGAPAAVPGLTTVTSVSAGHDQACAVAAGVVKCWGSDTITQHNSPVTIANLNGASAVATGAMHACALVSETVKCWGDNGFGQLGDGGNVNSSSTPITVLGGVAKISAGHFSTCAVKKDGTIWCWGFNNEGQIGHPNAGSNVSSPTPQQVTGL